jgi:isopenicillin N synthase-like dioxygenase
MSSALPLIDLSSWAPSLLPTHRSDLSAEQRLVAQTWDATLSNCGYAILINHGIDDAVFSELNEEALHFFAHPYEEKARYSRGAYGHPLGGFTAVGIESVAQSVSSIKSERDPVENFVFTSDPNQFEHPVTGEVRSPIAAASSYYHRMEQLLLVLHRLSAAALNLDDLQYFERYYDSDLPGNGHLGRNGNCLRLAHYIARPTTSDPANNAYNADESIEKLSYGAHTDYQGFTILRADKRDWHVTTMPDGTEVQFGGLQVLSQWDQTWRSVSIPPDVNALIVNAGDLIQRWTNDRWVSPMHRVMSPSGPSIDRQSIVFFSGPLAHSQIVSIVHSPDEQAHYAPICSGEHLKEKLERSNK